MCHKVCIADSVDCFRRGLAWIVQQDQRFELTGVASNAVGLSSILDSRRIDIALVGDLDTESLDLVRRFSTISIIVIDDDNRVKDVLLAGAKGYLSRRAPEGEFLQAMNAVSDGGTFFKSDLLEAALRQPSSPTLTPREMEVLQLSCDHQAREVAARLFISEAAVRKHLTHIYAKLGVQNKSAAVTEAWRRGLFVERRQVPRAAPQIAA